MISREQRLELKHNLACWRHAYKDGDVQIFKLVSNVISPDFKLCSFRQQLSLAAYEIIEYSKIASIPDLHFLTTTFNHDIYVGLCVLDNGVQRGVVPEDTLRELFEYMCDGYNEGPLSMVSASRETLEWYLELGNRLMPRFIKYSWFLDTYASVSQIRPLLGELNAYRNIPEDYLQTFKMLDLSIIESIKHYENIRQEVTMADYPLVSIP